MNKYLTVILPVSKAGAEGHLFSDAWRREYPYVAHCTAICLDLGHLMFKASPLQAISVCNTAASAQNNRELIKRRSTSTELILLWLTTCHTFIVVLWHDILWRSATRFSNSPIPNPPLLHPSPIPYSIIVDLAVFFNLGHFKKLLFNCFTLHHI